MSDQLDRSRGHRRAVSAVALALLLVVAAVAAAAAGGVGPFEPEPTSFGSVVVFRNDDVQPHYRTEALEAVTSVFVEEGVPVTHAVIPTAGGAPITDDPWTCDYLTGLRERRGPDVELAVHGYAHRPATDFFGRSEFGDRPAGEQRAMIEEATSIHESCTGTTPGTFVPPFDTYDDATVEALADAGYTTVSGGQAFTRSHFGRTGPFQEGGLVHAPNTGGLVANWSTHEFHSQETLRDAFDAAHANGSVYVQMLHHPTFTTGPNESTVSDRKLDRLRAFVRYVEGHDVKVMTLGDFGAAYASGRLQRTADGWELVEPGDPLADCLVAALYGGSLAARARSGRTGRNRRTPRRMPGLDGRDPEFAGSSHGGRVSCESGGQTAPGRVDPGDGSRR